MDAHPLIVIMNPYKRYKILQVQDWMKNRHLEGVKKVQGDIKNQERLQPLLMGKLTYS